MIIASAGIKGGAGKTTTSIVLTEIFDATLIDCDIRQKSAYIKAKEMGLTTALIPENESEVKNFMTQLKESSTSENLIIFDTGGKDTRANRMAMMYSDLILLPTSYSVMDMRGLDETMDLIDELNSYSDDINLNYKILINNIDSRTSDFHKAKKVLDAKDLPYFPFCIGRYKAIPNSIEQNKSIFEMGDEKASFCFERLVKAINRELFTK
jgi:chromosome partitioning protein